MASSPALKVYSPEGEYVGSAKELMGAGVMAQVYGDGSTIRLGHNKKSILWTEGVDGFICDSYDTAGAKMLTRAHEAFHHLIIF
jgi:hypothetical protein